MPSRDMLKRLEALEQRRSNPEIPDSLGYFYDLPEAQRAGLMAHMYGGEQAISSEEAERVYREIMQ